MPTSSSTTAAQSHPLRRQFLFNCFHHRHLIAQNITAALALRFKRRYPVCIVKFSGFEGGTV